MKHYGFRFRLNKTGLLVILNGLVISFGQTSSGTWNWRLWENYWRSHKVPINDPEGRAIHAALGTFRRIT